MKHRVVQASANQHSRTSFSYS